MAIHCAAAKHGIGPIDKKENVAISNALQLEAARAAPALSRFN